ncbi:protein SHORT ROOT IN SALT MEDIUM 1-like, partial [Telopea speciosissima]|uniref:protein SHORT ROOT IN SALT MEDIUM 1-like n=1 Tax=Telopea speciosissima TaxID=54955 RepID=UPI001CC71116
THTDYPNTTLVMDSFVFKFRVPLSNGKLPALFIDGRQSYNFVSRSVVEILSKNDQIHSEDLYSSNSLFLNIVTVHIVKYLSDCLTSLEVWRDHWVVHKKAIAERESQLSLKKKSTEKKVAVKGDRSRTNSDKTTDSNKNANAESSSEKDGKEEKKAPHTTPAEQAVDVNKMEKVDGAEVKENATGGEVAGDRKIEGKDGEAGGEGKHVVKEVDEPSVAQATEQLRFRILEKRKL